MPGGTFFRQPSTMAVRYDENTGRSVLYINVEDQVERPRQSDN